ncbi:MAG: hypothetical protein MUC48_10560 [Leptolyngbya sp. Prado105]|jgi:hypothetical protein|nr:hypothetical protein [Leptolyngbya sp. Prado105]
MTDKHFNHSPKALEPNHQTDFSSIVEPKFLAPDQESSLIAQQSLPPPAEPPVHNASEIALPTPIPRRRIKPKHVVIATSVAAVIMGGAIAANTVRTNQYQKIAEAHTLLSEACHTPTLADATALSAADNTWNAAEAQLQGIPPIPGFGIRDAQALRATYASCKINIDATRLSQEVATRSKAARAAVKQSAVLPEEEWVAHVTQLNAAIEYLEDIQTRFGDPAELAQSMPIFGTVEKQLKEYKQIRTVAQDRHDTERNAVQNLKAAQSLYQQFEANPNPSDATQRERTEATLLRAIARLNLISLEGTTVSADASSYRQTYAKALSDFRAAPRRQQLRQLAERFKQLASALRSGMTTDELSSTLERIGRELAQLQQAPNSSQALRYFQTALDDYRFAQSLMLACARQDNCSTGLISEDLFVRPTSPLYRKLIDFYSANTELFQGQSINEKAALGAIATHANQNVETAQKLIEQ